jgi:hypothetical protein
MSGPPRNPTLPEAFRRGVRRRRLARLPLDLGLLVLAASFPCLARAKGEALGADEDVLFLPGIARLLDNG